ncbi:hypothetical protein AKO1_011582, partial [Acrasis kona]
MRERELKILELESMKKEQLLENKRLRQERKLQKKLDAKRLKEEAAKYLVSKPLFKLWEEKAESIAAAEQEEKRMALAQLHANFKKNTLEEVNKFQREYDERMKESQLNKRVTLDNSRHKPLLNQPEYYAGKSRELILLELKIKKEAEERDKLEREELLRKKKEYAEKVHKEHAPKIDVEKRAEIEGRVKKDDRKLFVSNELHNKIMTQMDQHVREVRSWHGNRAHKATREDRALSQGDADAPQQKKKKRRQRRKSAKEVVMEHYIIGSDDKQRKKAESLQEVRDIGKQYMSDAKKMIRRDNTQSERNEVIEGLKHKAIRLDKKVQMYEKEFFMDADTSVEISAQNDFGHLYYDSLHAKIRLLSEV